MPPPPQPWEERGGDVRDDVARITAEFLGTIVVTLGTVAPAALASGLGFHLGYAVEYGCTGIATMVVIYAFGQISGAHTNPCTTLAFALRGDFAWKRVPSYVVAQFAGAFAAGEIVVAILHPARRALIPQMQLGAWPACWSEIVLTCILIAVAVATANHARFVGPESAIANGATTIFDRLISGPISSGSMNPARTLGPAIVAGGFSQWWVYVSAPLIGMAIAVALVWVVCGSPTRQEAQHSGG